ncbi:MAG: GLUG motif-containing protein [Candidatus Marinimicrobia bacterium]|nr:GLUG motif-containing protein [Candidatus Neomarinimicrobiota bacterium]
MDWDGDGTLQHGTGGDDTYGFSPIGNSSTKFNSNGYDGNEKTISNLFINRPTTDYIGLFGRTSSCIIDNLGLIDVNITGNNGVGALSGYDYVSSNVTNCYSTGNVDGYNNEVGGLIGENWAEIDNCYSSSKM